MTLAFVLDEHHRGPFWEAALRHNVLAAQSLDVTRVGELPDLPLGIKDPDWLLWAEREARILVTEDRRAVVHLKRHLAAGHHSPGIFVTRLSASNRELLDFLQLATYAGEPDDFADRITYIP